MIYHSSEKNLFWVFISSRLLLSYLLIYYDWDVCCWEQYAESQPPWHDGKCFNLREIDCNIIISIFSCVISTFSIWGIFEIRKSSLYFVEKKVCSQFIHCLIFLQDIFYFSLFLSTVLLFSGQTLPLSRKGIPATLYVRKNLYGFI